MKAALWLIVTVILAATATANGLCQLNKYNYLPGGNGLLSCSCTDATEENIAGNIIYKNATHVLHNDTTFTTAACRTSAATHEYTFGYGDGAGTAYLETAAATWNQASDNRTDNFLVSGAAVKDCLLTDFEYNEVNRLGALLSTRAKIKDGNSLHTIGGAFCMMSVYDVNGSPRMVEPYAAWPAQFRKSSSNGELAFQHEMSEYFWMPNTTYLAEFHCNCPTALASSTEACYDLENGSILTFKDCTAEFAFTTGEDLRTQLLTTSQYGILAIIIVLPLLLSFILLYGGMNMGEAHAMLKVFLFLLPFVAFFSSYHMAMLTVVKYFNFTELQDYIGSTTYWIGLVMYVVIAYFILYLTAIAFHAAAQKKKEKLEY